MIVGIDGDVLRYELGAVAMEKELVFDIEVIRPWPDADVRALVDDRIQHIMERTGATKVEIYLTGPGNFRNEIATIAPYKGNRQGLEKPYHWQTVSDYLIESGAKVCCGIEADDALAMRGAALGPTQYTVASRDKDLRMTPCRHYSWACGETQPEIGPFVVQGIGEVECHTRTRVNNKGKTVHEHKMKGNGLKFFYGQLLTGDGVDNIKGCKGVGPKNAVDLILTAMTEKDLFNRVATQYGLKYGDDWKTVLEENARLLWLVQDRDWLEFESKGNELHCKVKTYWECPYEDYERYEPSREDRSSN